MVRGKEEDGGTERRKSNAIMDAEGNEGRYEKRMRRKEEDEMN